MRRRLRRRLGALAAALLVGATAIGALAALHGGQPPGRPDPEPAYDPLERARETLGRVGNREAPVPPQCYTKTAGVSNPCWTCHTGGLLPNAAEDGRLQEEYAFSEVALDNHWRNLFRDRSAAVARISDAELLGHVRSDNYGPLRAALRSADAYPGFVPDLDLDAGVDAQGFAIDGSGWRAIRYKPLAGSFWPTNGSTDDVFVRLPRSFREDARGRPDREIERANLSILEAAIAAAPDVPVDRLSRTIEPLDERRSGVDLDRDGRLGHANRIVGLPERYVGGAREVLVRRWVYPGGVELLHTVRYCDPERPDLLSRHLKELRYARKVMDLDDWAILRAYERAHEEKSENNLPVFAGSPLVGLRNDFGWQLQGFIEDEHGRLRLQTEEEHLFCMGCHSNLGVTVDQTFALARKVPGAAGWRHQDLRGIPDAPQSGHRRPETVEYFERVGGGDELRANREILERFFHGGLPDPALVGRAGDLAALTTPSRARALALGKQYLALVREQRFEEGRDAPLSPARNVHAHIRNGSTDLARTGRLHHDGQLHLDWPE